MEKVWSFPDDIDVTALAAACRAIVAKMVEEGMNYPHIADEAEVNLSALKQFVGRTDPSYGRRSNVLSGLYDFFNSYLQRPTKFQDPVRTMILEYPTLFDLSTPLSADASEPDARPSHDRAVAGTYKLILAMLKVDGSHMARVCAKMEGYYACYRHSIHSGKFIKSILQIRQKSQTEAEPVWEFVNSHQIGSMGATGVSSKKETADGIVIPIKNNIFMIGDVEQGQGIDYFLLREPFNREFDRVLGFEVTIDNDGIPLFSKVVCRRLEVDREKGGVDIPTKEWATAHVIGAETLIKEPDGKWIRSQLVRATEPGVIRVETRLTEE